MKKEDDIADIVSAIAEWIDITAKSGMVNAADLAQQTRDRIDDELGDETDAATVSALEERARTAVAAREADEKTWPAVTMNDRIDRAFEELNRSGIIALQGAGYTMSEGWDEANDIASSLPSPPRGAVFYHWQDLERAVAGDGLWLAYGAYTDDEIAQDELSLAIGREALEALNRAEVPAIWDGTIDARVFIQPFTWQRRYRAEE